MATVDRTKLLRLIEDEDAQIVDVLPEREYVGYPQVGLPSEFA